MRRGRSWLAPLAGLGAVCLAAAGLVGAAAAVDRRPPIRYASPAAIVAAEIAFAQLAQRKGQWTAFRATAADDAVMFVPQPVPARAWLKKQPDPPRAVAWQPHQVWLSCDGSLAASYGAWQQPNGTNGYFTTIWQRQPKGDYKWVMDQGDTLGEALSPPEMIASKVAPCVRGGPRGGMAASKPPARTPATSGGGRSDDGTMTWSVAVDAECGRALTVSLSQGPERAMVPVLEKRVAPPLGADGKPSATCVPT